MGDEEKQLELMRSAFSLYSFFESTKEWNSASIKEQTRQLPSFNWLFFVYFSGSLILISGSHASTPLSTELFFFPNTAAKRGMLIHTLFLPCIFQASISTFYTDMRFFFSFCSSFFSTILVLFPSNCILPVTIYTLNLIFLSFFSERLKHETTRLTLDIWRIPCKSLRDLLPKSFSQGQNYCLKACVKFWKIFLKGPCSKQFKGWC